MATTALHAERASLTSSSANEEEEMPDPNVVDDVPPSDAITDDRLVTSLMGDAEEFQVPTTGLRQESGPDPVLLQGQGRLADPRTIQAFTTSKLCLVPAGDTPTSRRLFDAMAAGCVPVLLTPFEDIFDNLPFHQAIDWRSTVLFGGGLQCSMVENAESTVRWIRNLLKEENAKKLRCMARRAQRVFTKYLSFRDEGVVSGLLNELRHDHRYSGLLQAQPVATRHQPVQRELVTDAAMPEPYGSEAATYGSEAAPYGSDYVAPLPKDNMD